MIWDNLGIIFQEFLGHVFNFLGTLGSHFSNSWQKSAPVLRNRLENTTRNTFPKYRPKYVSRKQLGQIQDVSGVTMDLKQISTPTDIPPRNTSKSAPVVEKSKSGMYFYPVGVRIIRVSALGPNSAILIFHTPDDHQNHHCFSP